MKTLNDIPRGLQSIRPHIIYAIRHREGPWLTINERWTIVWYSRASAWNSRRLAQAICGSKKQALRLTGQFLELQAPWSVLIRKPNRPRDTQRMKLYTWEDQYVIGLNHFSETKWPNLTLKSCEHIIVEIFTDYGKCPPEVDDGRGCKAALGSAHKIRLPKWARILPVVLHEAVHGLIDSPNIEGHGPLFVRTYIDLLSNYGGFNKEWIEEKAIQCGLRVNGVGQTHIETRVTLANYMDHLLENHTSMDEIIELLQLEVARRGSRISATKATIRAHLRHRQRQGKLLDCILDT